MYLLVHKCTNLGMGVHLEPNILKLMARYVFLCLFLTEMLVRMYALGPRIYFESSFNRCQSVWRVWFVSNQWWRTKLAGWIWMIRFDCVVICASVFEMVYTCLRWDTFFVFVCIGIGLRWDTLFCSRIWDSLHWWPPFTCITFCLY